MSKDKWTYPDWGQWNGLKHRHLIIITTLLRLGVKWDDTTHIEFTTGTDSEVHIQWKR